MKLFMLLVALLAATRLVGALQPPNFSAVDAHFDANLGYFTGAPEGTGLYVEVRQAGELLYTYQAGWLDRDTAIPFASASKMVSAAVVLSLAERPEWDIHQPMGETVLLMNAYDMGALTPYHGFTMTSGLCSNPDLEAQCPRYSLIPTINLEQSAFLIIANIPVHYAPGTVMMYDGYGMQLTGYTATRVFSQSWENLARETVFLPLQMNSSSYTAFGINPGIGGALVSSASDYMTFMQMIANDGVHDGVRLLSEESIALMWENHTQGLPSTYSPFHNVGDLELPYDLESLDYGFGSWILAQDPESDEVEEICSPGGFGTFPWIDRKRNLTGIIVTEMPAGTRRWAVETQAIQLIRQAVDDAGSGDLLAIR